MARDGSGAGLSPPPPGRGRGRRSGGHASSAHGPYSRSVRPTTAPSPHPGRPTGTCPSRRNARTSPDCSAPASSAAPSRRGSRSRDPSRADRTGRPRAAARRARETRPIVAAANVSPARPATAAEAPRRRPPRSPNDPWRPCGRPFRQRRPGHPERLEHPARMTCLERLADTHREMGAHGVEARVRIDPPGARAPRASSSLELEAGCVGEEMSDGRPGGPAASSS